MDARRGVLVICALWLLWMYAAVQAKNDARVYLSTKRGDEVLLTAYTLLATAGLGLALVSGGQGGAWRSESLLVDGGAALTFSVGTLLSNVAIGFAHSSVVVQALKPFEYLLAFALLAPFGKRAGTAGLVHAAGILAGCGLLAVSAIGVESGGAPEENGSLPIIGLSLGASSMYAAHTVILKVATPDRRITPLTLIIMAAMAAPVALLHPAATGVEGPLAVAGWSAVYMVSSMLVLARVPALVFFSLKTARQLATTSALAVYEGRSWPPAFALGIAALVCTTTDMTLLSAAGGERGAGPAGGDEKAARPQSRGRPVPANRRLAIAVATAASLYLSLAPAPWAGPAIPASLAPAPWEGAVTVAAPLAGGGSGGGDADEAPDSLAARGPGSGGGGDTAPAEAEAYEPYVTPSGAPGESLVHVDGDFSAYLSQHNMGDDLLWDAWRLLIAECKPANSALDGGGRSPAFRVVGGGSLASWAALGISSVPPGKPAFAFATGFQDKDDFGTRITADVYAGWDGTDAAALWESLPAGLQGKIRSKLAAISKVTHGGFRGPILEEMVRRTAGAGVTTRPMIYDGGFYTGALYPPVPGERCEIPGFGDVSGGDYAIFNVRHSGTDLYKQVDAAAAALEAAGTSVYHVPMAMNDAKACQTSGFPGAELRRCATAVPEMPTMMACLRGARLVIGNRLHTCIMALAAGAPLSCLAYDLKHWDAMSAVGEVGRLIDARSIAQHNLTDVAFRLAREPRGPLRERALALEKRSLGIHRAAWADFLGAVAPSPGCRPASCEHGPPHVHHTPMRLSYFCAS